VVIWSYHARLKMALRCRQPNLQTSLVCSFSVPVWKMSTQRCRWWLGCMTFDRVVGATARWRPNF